jgi:hypothetical protein
MSHHRSFITDFTSLQRFQRHRDHFCSHNLLARKDQTLLIRRDTLLVLDLALDSLDGVTGLHIQSDGLACQRLHEDLHTTTQAQHQVEGEPQQTTSTLLQYRDELECVRAELQTVCLIIDEMMLPTNSIQMRLKVILHLLPFTLFHLDPTNELQYELRTQVPYPIYVFQLLLPLILPKTLLAVL